MNQSIEQRPTLIGFRKSDFTVDQYKAHAEEYANSNRFGLRGGRTPVERVDKYGLVLPPGRTVFEIGPGPGHDAAALVARGYKFKGGDVAFVNNLRDEGFDVDYFDARVDDIPEGVDGIYAHISLEHVTPLEFARVFTSARQRLGNEKAFFVSLIEGYGHERSARTGSFMRDWFYYTPNRLRQILDQEGFDIAFLDRVEAVNGTPTLHVGGRLGKYEGRSYGERGVHPFGDVYYDIESLYEGNIVADVVDAQVKERWMDEEKGEYLKTAKGVYERGKIPFAHLIKEVNDAWAKVLVDQDVEVLVEHAREVFRRKSPFREFVPAVFAVNNNNGFSNILNGYEPSWLMYAATKHVGADYNGLSTAQWFTDTENPFKGRITGKVKYFPKQPDLKGPVQRHIWELRKLFGQKYRRISEGVGSSLNDRASQEITDYPVILFADNDLIRYAHEQGYFTDKNGLNLHAGHVPWARWGAVENGDGLAKYSHMISSGRFPVLHNMSKEARRRLRRTQLWKSEDNELNEDFYKENPLTTTQVMYDM